MLSLSSWARSLRQGETHRIITLCAVMYKFIFRSCVTNPVHLKERFFCRKSANLVRLVLDTAKVYQPAQRWFHENKHPQKGDPPKLSSEHHPFCHWSSHLIWLWHLSLHYIILSAHVQNDILLQSAPRPGRSFFRKARVKPWTQPVWPTNQFKYLSQYRRISAGQFATINNYNCSSARFNVGSHWLFWSIFGKQGRVRKPMYSLPPNGLNEPTVSLFADTWASL